MTIRIPSTEKKFSQPNNSDLFGNIFCTKNINFDLEGYIKLSDRSVQLVGEEDTATADVPTSVGRFDSTFNTFAVGTADSSFNLNLSNSSFSVAEDTATNNPTLTFDSGGVWWQNRWHESTATAIFYKTSLLGNWTDSGVSLTTGKVHVMEVFITRLQLCVANGNVVKQYDTSYANTQDLTLPSDYEVIGLAFSGSRMGIITMLSDTITGQNKEAVFATWDGTTGNANTMFGVGSDMCVGIVAYKSSWAILTRTGELKYFNGGGFELLARLPFYFKDAIWGDSSNREALAGIMSVDGENIYININNEMAIYGMRGESVLPYYPGGVWCYDPKIGLYHRYSASNSPANAITVTDANVNTTTNILTSTAGTLYDTGNPIKYIYNGITPIGGLMAGRVYYVIKHTSTTFSLALTRADAIAGNKIDLTSVGDSNNYFLALKVVDYGAYFIGRTGAIGQYGTTNNVISHLIHGCEVYDTNSVNSYGTICMTVSGFKNIGYLLTPKMTSTEIEDSLGKILSKFKPLRTGEKIIIKLKDIDVLDIPVTTPQYNVHCTWTSSTVFTTTADLSAVLTYINDNSGECETEIISGAGAGQMAQISTIAFAGGTYTVTLAEELEGVSQNDVCDIIIDNWRKIGEITSEDTLNYQELSIQSVSKWGMLKIEMRGDNITIEETVVTNANQKSLK